MAGDPLTCGPSTARRSSCRRMRQRRKLGRKLPGPSAGAWANSEFLRLSFGDARVNIQVPYGGLRLTTNSDGPGSRKHTYVRFTCSPPEHLPTSRLHNVIFELDSDTLRA